MEQSRTWNTGIYFSYKKRLYFIDSKLRIPKREEKVWVPKISNVTWDINWGLWLWSGQIPYLTESPRSADVSFPGCLHKDTLAAGSQALREASEVVLVVKNPPANAGHEGDTGSVLGSGRSPRGGNGNPLQYSCLENPMDREAWWATAWRVLKSWTWLSD